MGKWSSGFRRVIRALLGEEQEHPPDSGETITAPEAQGFLNKPAGSVEQTFGNATVQGDNYGQNIGQMTGGSVFYLAQAILGSDPDDAYQHDLERYLKQFAHSLHGVPLLNAVAPKLAERGHEIGLPDIYTMLATTQWEVFAQGTKPRGWSQYYKDDERIPAHHPDHALPYQAILSRQEQVSGQSDSPGWTLWRARLATEAMIRYHRLVLLGSPGSGKSTFVRHLAWSIAQHTLGQPMSEPALPTALRQKLPAILPLRRLAALLEEEPNTLTAVKRGLVEEMQQHYAGAVDVAQVLGMAMDRGAIVLLFDGLDEVPVVGASGQRASRAATFAAVREIAQACPAVPTVVTCRVRAYEPFQEMGIAGWHDEELAAFTFGQIQHFVRAWYRELAIKAPELVKPAQAEAYTTELLDALRNPMQQRLRAIAANPLLLTMMAWVLCNEGELPRDRPTLYEHILRQLLWQWDKLRQYEDLAAYARLVDMSSDSIRPVFDSLSYKAHRDANSEDGRGRLTEHAIRTALEDHFVQAGVLKDEAARIAVRCVEYFDFRSGLLQPDGQQRDVYVFAHLTLQEHCAGRHIVFGSTDPVALVMQHRGDDRWREPIFLGLGLAPPADLDDVFDALLATHDYQQTDAKSVARRYRDLILAAELGVDRKWSSLQTLVRFKAQQHKETLRTGLAALLNDADQPLPVAERVRAGFLLGDLGDPRFPVTIEQWQAEAERALNGDSSGYFCRVEPGTYIIGSSDDDPGARDEKPQHTVTFEQPFWIARLPLTNAQWQEWVREAEGQPSYAANDSDLNHPNQPVVNVTWYMCRDFCRWLSEQTGLTIRLPSEAEWEAAARGGDARRYPWGNDWRDDHAATKEDQETRGTRWSTPVGCYPQGAAPGGALDVAGNVWEWTHTPWAENHDPPRSTEREDDAKLFTLKRGSYCDMRTLVRCAARARIDPLYYGNLDDGFRVLFSPRVQ
jgi:formylglycine-generating enzyme required for sulfatase activity/energy-coupling factor transporter ATP-binding protein EcfA2